MWNLDELGEIFAMHPRATRAHVPATDYNGREWPVTLEQCYKSPSTAKCVAYRYWRDVYCSFGVNGARRWCITGFNCNFFTIEFEFKHPETGEWWRAIATGKTSQAWRVA